jgi:hypothetical protein
MYVFTRKPAIQRFGISRKDLASSDLGVVVRGHRLRPGNPQDIIQDRLASIANTLTMYELPVSPYDNPSKFHFVQSLALSFLTRLKVYLKCLVDFKQYARFDPISSLERLRAVESSILEGFDNNFCCGLAGNEARYYLAVKRAMYLVLKDTIAECQEEKWVALLQ